MTILGLLIAVIVIALVWWAVETLTNAFGLDPRIKAVITVLLVVVVVLWLLGGIQGGLEPIRLR